jgi:hypothetical protein
MRLAFALFLLLPAGVFSLLAAEPSSVQDGQWGSLKGQIIWGGAMIPPREELDVSKDQSCLMGNPTANAEKGTILDEKLMIDPKTKGLKYVYVWILAEGAKKIAIHPKMKEFPKEIVIDQPCCMFWPRALAMREGQVFVVKNSSPIKHNIRWLPDEKSGSAGGSVIVESEDQIEIKDLKAQRLPIPLECNIHPWMKGSLGVFNHPYFAVTDDKGNFEIKDAPAGKHKLMIYHDEIGYRLGQKSKTGEDVVIQAGKSTDLGQLPMGK